MTVEAPLFMTVSVTHPGVNFRPGDTDPKVPLVLTGPLAQWRAEQWSQKKRDGITVLINEMVHQSDSMEAGGKKNWWDNTDFEDIIPNGVDYPCSAELGTPPELKQNECLQASFEFIKKGSPPPITPGSPLYFRSGE